MTDGDPEDAQRPCGSIEARGSEVFSTSNYDCPRMSHLVSKCASCGYNDLMRHPPTSKNLTKGAIAGARTNLSCGVKTCTTCGVVQSVDEFHAARAGIGAVASVCKECTRKYDKERRTRKAETDVVFRVNKAILKRQEYGTDTCLLSEKSAYMAAAHLMDEFGLMTVEDGHTFRSIFKANLPDKLKQTEARVGELAKRREARAELAAEKAEIRAAIKAAEKEERRLNARTLDLTEENLNTLIYRRLQHHLKNKRRKLKATDFSFTKVNFTSITGYTPGELRIHLSKHIPDGKTWADVVSGALHIEHITPSAAFDLTTLFGVRSCYAMSNLTLLTAEENNKKAWSSDKGTVVHFRSDPELARLFGLTE